MIAHVALETAPADAAAATAFWQELGFVLVDPPPTLADRAAWLERHGTQIHLLWTEHPTTQHEGHVAIVVADYPATVGRLRAAGHEVVPRTEHWGSPRTFLRAPGGHRVELMAAPPASPPATGGADPSRGPAENPREDQPRPPTEEPR